MNVILVNGKPRDARDSVSRDDLIQLAYGPAADPAGVTTVVEYRDGDAFVPLAAGASVGTRRGMVFRVTRQEIAP